MYMPKRPRRPFFIPYQPLAEKPPGRDDGDRAPAHRVRCRVQPRPRLRDVDSQGHIMVAAGAHRVARARRAHRLRAARARAHVRAHPPGGEEIEWGEVVEWDPPRRLRYLWHIATDPQHATERPDRVPPRASRDARGDRAWRLALGDIGQAWRDANQAGWDGVLPSYAEAARTTGASASRTDPAGTSERR